MNGPEYNSILNIDHFTSLLCTYKFCLYYELEVTHSVNSNLLDMMRSSVLVI